MTIGQALALMRSAEQFKDYQNRLNAQPTIDWRDVTQQQVGPEAPPVGYASMPMGQAVFAAPPPVPAEEYTQYEAPVGPPDQYAVESPVAGEPYVPMEQAPEPLGPAPFDYSAVVSNAQPEPVSPASQFAAYQQRVGAVGPDMFSRDFYEPQTDYSTRPPQQQAAFAALPFTSEVETQGTPKLPPPPIPGARRPESSAMFGLRPEAAMTDVPMEEPISAGADIAMLEQPAAEEQPAPKAGEQPSVWTPGQKFDATLKFGEKQYPATVTRYTPAEDGGRKYPAKVTLDLGGGKTRTIEVAPEDPNYKAIESQYQGLVDKGGKELQYTAKVKVGNDFLPARYDPESRQIKYLDTSLEDPTQKAEFVYAEKPISKLTPEEFIGSIDAEGKPDVKELEKIKRESRMALSTKIRGAVPGLVRGWRGPDSREDIRDRLVGKLTATDKDPVGTIEWSYNEYDKQGNFVGQITLKEAIQRGIVPKRVADNLEKQWKTALGTYEGYMKSAEAAQGIESPTARDRNVVGIKKNIDDLTEQIKQLDADYTDGKITLDQRDDLKDKAQKALDKERADLIDAMSATPGIINTGGGTVGYEAPPSEIGSSVIPRTVLGLRALLAGAPAVQPANVAPGEVTPFTDEQIIGNLKTRALEDVKTRSLKDDPNFAKAMVGWQNRILDIEDYLGKIADEQDTTVDEILSRPTKFTYYIDPTLGSDVTESKTMPLDTAIDEFLGSIQNLRIVLGSGDELEIATAREKFEEMAKMFSGNIKIRGVDVNNPEAQNIFAGQYDTEEGLGRDSALLGARNFFDIDKQMNMPVIRSEEFAPTTVERRAPESTVTRTPSGSGRTTPPPTSYPAFPVYYTPEDKYVKADTSTNFFEMINKNDQAYDKASANYTADAADRMTAAGIARALMRDGGGALQPDEIKAVTSTIDNLNKEIIKSPQMREAIVETIVETIEAAGIPISQDYSALASALEKVFNTASRPGVTDSEIQGMINRIIYGDRTASPQPWPGAFEFGNMPAVNTLVAKDSSAGLQAQNLASNDPGKYGGRIAWGSTRSSSRLLDNAIQMIYDLALLYAAAGKGKTEYNVGPYTVTWFYNPLDPNQPRHQSVMTMPASIDQSSTGGTTAPPTTRGQAQNPASAPSPRTGVEPAMGGVMVKLQKIFGPRQYGVLSNAIGGVSAPIVREAKKNYDSLPADSNGLRNLHGVTSARPKDDEATKWTQQSGEMVSKVFGDQLLLGMIFGKRRDRQSFRSGGLQPFVSPNP